MYTLIIDDSRAMRRILSKIVKPLGFEVIEAENGREGFEKLVANAADIEPARMAKALIAGVDEFVMKPFTKEILVEKLSLIGVKMQTPNNLLKLR